MPRFRFATTLGFCSVSWTERGVSKFSLPPAAAVDGDAADAPPEIARIIARVQAHLAGEPQDFSDATFDYTALPDFACEVYRRTLRIGPGRTATYGDIARDLGLPPGASRAVGSALGANPIPLLIPCHRVIAASGKMTGFSGPGGVATKIRLLALENAELPLG